MPRLLNVIGLGMLGVTLVGCVSPEMYEAQKMRNQELAEQNATDANTIKDKDAQIRALNALTASSKGGSDAASGQVDNLKFQLDQSNKENADLLAKYNKLIGLVGQQAPSPLTQQMTSQLTDFASQNADTIDFDSVHGVVKFKSDVTFAPGDATVTAKVKEILAKFAAILNKPGAEKYDLLIEGHTDDTPITNPETIRRGHLDNWYLSAHRAIAVKQELVADSVTSKRIGVVGFADKRPAASNGTAAGKAKNRRVEVVILPGHDSSVAAPTDAGDDTSAPAPRTSTDGAQPIGNRQSPTAGMNK